MGIPPNLYLDQDQDPQQPQQPQAPANNAQNAGPVKTGLRSVLSGILRSFSYGASQGMLKAAGEETDAEKATRLVSMAHLNAQTQLIKQQTQMVPVQLGNGTVVHLPPKMASDLLKQQLANQGKTDTARIQKRFLTTPNGLYDTQSQDANGYPTLIPNSGAGIPITSDIATQYGLPQAYVGKNMKLTDLAAIERGSAQQNAVVQGASGPVVANKTTGVAKPVTVNGKPIGSPAQAGAYWQAKYGVVQTVDSDGNPVYSSRLNAPGAPTNTGALQIFKGKAGLDNYKDALTRVQNNLDVLDDPTQRALVAQTLRNIGTVHDPGIVSSFIGNAISGGMSPQAADVTAAMLQAKEFIGANRQFAGNFNGSEALYNRMVANAPGVGNAKQLNQALISQDLANTARIESRMKAFQGGKDKQNPKPAETGGFDWGKAPVKAQK